MQRLSFLAGFTLLIAGIVHLVIAPDHLSHAPAHGLAFGAIGLAQVGWAVLAWRQRADRARSTGLLISGIALSGGIIELWLLTHFVRTPFADSAHALDLAAVVTKFAELFALTALLALLMLRGETPVHLRRVIGRAAGGTLSAIVIGFALWGMGLLAEPLLPASGHSHDHTGHDHGAPAALTISTAAYFSIVNSGREPDVLVGVSGEDVGTLTLHRTTIDERQIARMRDLEQVTLNPHTRVDFAPTGDHIMLESLPRDLYEGDSITLTLHFASGRSIPVEFAARTDPPQGRLNFVSRDGFQISNAWVWATRTLDSLAATGSTTYRWRLPAGFPVPVVPAHNPMTEEKVELGRYLFYDPRLSGNGSFSCSSCHLQALAFTDGRATAIGSTGDIHPRNSQTLTNAAYNATLTWANPNLLTLEQQILIPMFGEHPVELGITGQEDVVLARFRGDPQYRELFAAAFPDQSDPFTFNNIVQALASFTRTLISGDSAFDRYLRGERDALSESAQRGMELFFSEGLECHHCHTGFNLTLSTISVNSSFIERPFFNTGLYNLDGRGAYPVDNTGVHEITNNPADMGRFRPPTLRNIALTAPYMHDGSIATLEDVIRFYMNGGRVIESGPYAGDGRANPYKSGLVAGFSLTEQEIADLVAFLESLTDETFISDPRLSDPFQQSDS
ncbi:MAG: MbnH family di-heme enzyme [Candidatus Flexifilum sp.]|jgi:cytochrome c peroxidase